MIESKIQSNIINFLNKNGWIPVKNIQTNLNGFPDLTCLKNGISVFIECKSKNGVLSELQKYRHKQLTEQGFKVFVIYSFDEFKEIYYKNMIDVI